MWNNSSSPSPSTSEQCQHSPVYNILHLSRSIIQTLLNLLVALYVLYLGYRRWKPQRSFNKISHSDVFTYNMALTLLQADLGSGLSIYGTYASSDAMTRAGDYLYNSHFVAEMLVHGLTCVDRYLAIVHPVFYLRLKQRRGVVVRNVSLGIVWALTLGYIGLKHLYFPDYPNKEFLSLLIAIFLVVSFCSVSVLRALTRRAPGDNDRCRMDQWKQRAFQTVMAIMVIVLVWVVGVLVILLAGIYTELHPVTSCLMFDSVIWLGVPCSLVLPVLYLHRAGKLSCSIGADPESLSSQANLP